MRRLVAVVFSTIVEESKAEVKLFEYGSKTTGPEEFSVRPDGSITGALNVTPLVPAVTVVLGVMIPTEDVVPVIATAPVVLTTLEELAN